MIFHPYQDNRTKKTVIIITTRSQTFTGNPDKMIVKCFQLLITKKHVKPKEEGFETHIGVQNLHFSRYSKENRFLYQTLNQKYLEDIIIHC